MVLVFSTGGQHSARPLWASPPPGAMETAGDSPTGSSLSWTMGGGGPRAGAKRPGPRAARGWVGGNLTARMGPGTGKRAGCRGPGAPTGAKRRRGARLPRPGPQRVRGEDRAGKVLRPLPPPDGPRRAALAQTRSLHRAARPAPRAAANPYENATTERQAAPPTKCPRDTGLRKEYDCVPYRGTLCCDITKEGVE